MNSRKYFYLLLLPLVALVSCSDDNGNGNNENQPSDEWSLLFEDEFDNGLGQWSAWNAGAFNEEIQLYQDDQLTTSNSILTISAERENVSGPTHPWDNSTKQFEYVSGRIETNALFGPKDENGKREYRIMARIKLPAGHGMWPAFWSYGDPWPTHGEIDIFEARGGEHFEFGSNLFYGPNEGVSINYNTEKHYTPGPDLTADFHTYEMIWKENSIEILFDDQLLHTYNADASNNIANMFGKQQKVVLNVAVGGWYFTDRNSANYADNASMQVDWVRVYRR